MERAEHTVLLIEDSDDDALLIGLACRKLDPRYHCARVGNGLEAIAYLTGQAPFNDRVKFPMPSLILLDLRMPVVDGFGFLEWIKQFDELIEIPVFALTSILDGDSAKRVAVSGAKGLLEKQADPSAIRAALRELLETWAPLKTN